MQAVILAGGKGTRLSADPDAPPKPLTPLGGVSVLDHLLGRIGPQGVGDIVICSSYRADMVERAIGDGARYGLRVRHVVERTPLGTAGAVRAVADLLDDRFLVVYGDVLADVDLAAMVAFHARSGALATLAVHPNDHPFDSDRVVTDRHGKVLRMARKEDSAGPEAGALCNAALYVVERRLVLDHIPDDGVARDFARDVFPSVLRGGGALSAWRTTEYLKDMGTPKRRARVEADLAAGVPARMRRASSRPAVLFDRDGVLVEDVPYITKAEEVALIPGAAHALARLNASHSLAAVCTNQPVIARGAITEDDLHALHRHIEGLFGREGAWIDGIFACPHHTDRGFAGERAELKIACDCRKPGAGLIHEAVAALSIDRRASVFVGDRTADLVAAKRGGVLPIGVRTGAACRDGKHPIAPEVALVDDVSEAVSLVLDTAPSWGPWLARVRAMGVVLLGGPSRSGKTLASTALRLALASLGVDALAVSLDRFILPACERRPGSTLRERIRFDEAQEAVRALVRGDAVLVPGYDPQTRGRAPSEVVQWDRRGVLVIDGLLAHALDLARDTFRVALAADPETLRARRAQFYQWKGLEGTAFADAVDGRADELTEVSATLSRADIRLSFDARRRLLEAP